MASHPQSKSAAISDQETQVLVTHTPLPKTDGESKAVLHRSHNFIVTTTAHEGHPTRTLKRAQGSLGPRILPKQEERIAGLETRLMPSVTLINPLPANRLRVPSWLETLGVWIGLLVALIGHTVNLFNYPRYELDEGTYISSAWAITQGMIQPYAYGYGHPPLAWIQIAAIVQSIGGFFMFGNALNTGRVAMLFFALGSTLLVYHIVCRLGASRSAALLAMIIFSLSPLSITYQRQILLDNVGTFWLLLSLYFLVHGNSRLLYVVLSAIALGISILSKEVFVLFIPAMIYAVWLHTTKFQRKFALVAFIYTTIAICSGFVLMAILKGELFPESWHVLGDNHPHLSMIDTYLQQTQRGSNQGDFLQNFGNWWNGDFILVLCSLIPIVFNLVIGWWYRKNLLMSVLGISFWLLLVRGGVVLSFYYIPLIPLAAINAAMAITVITNWLCRLTHQEIVRGMLFFALIIAITPYDIAKSDALFTQHPTSAQTDAMSWIHQNVPTSSFIVINSYLYMDLRIPGGQGASSSATYPFAHVYFNVAGDPEIYAKILQNNWDRIDYIVADSEMLTDINNNAAPNMKIIKDALNHSVRRAEFSAKDHDTKLVITIYQVRHKNLPPTVHVPLLQQQALVNELKTSY